MRSIITLEGIDEALKGLSYANKKALKYRLIQAIRKCYTDEKSIESVKAVDTDTLVNLLWDTGSDPAIIKNRRKNLNSIKSSINADLKGLYNQGKNPEGIIIGPDNTFDMSEEAKSEFLESFTFSTRGDSPVPLGKITDVLKVVNDLLTNDGSKTETETMIDQLKELVKSIAEKIGVSGKVGLAVDGAKDVSSPGLGGVGGDSKGGGQSGSDGLFIEEAEPEDEVEEIDDDELEEPEEEVEEIDTDELEEAEPEEEVEEVDAEELEEAEPEEEIEEIDDDVLEEAEPEEEVEEIDDDGLEEVAPEDEIEEIDDDELEEAEPEDEVEEIDDEELEEAEPEEEIEEIDADELEEAEPEDEVEEIDDTELEEAEPEEEVEEIDDDELEEAEPEDEVEEVDDAELEEVEPDEEVEEIDDDELDEVDPDEEVEEINDDVLDEAEPAEEIEEITEESEGPDLDRGNEQHSINMEELLAEYGDSGYEGEKGVQKARLLSEEFNSALSAMDRYYNQYILIPKAKYKLGSMDPDRNERPVKNVRLNAFYFGKFPVINAIFEIFIEKSGYITTAERLGYGTVYYGRYQNSVDNKTGLKTLNWNSSLTNEKVEGACWYQPLGPGSTLHNKRNHPVVQVSLEDAIAFAAWTGKRLPTEDEWEAASRTAKGYKFPWGGRFKKDSCNIEDAFIGDTTPVDNYTKNVNSLGVSDTIGNVLEWTIDRAEVLTNEKTGSSDYVVKGGSWSSMADVNLSSRFFSDPRTSSNILGFRCVAY